MMNANELIEFQEDKASEARANGFSDVRFMQTATMLRQQQAEIEALKAENKFFKDLMGDVEILRKVSEA